MTDATTASIQVSHRYTASAERVFDAWLDPELVRRFLFATPTGEVVRCDIDAQVGGRYSIVDRRDGEDVEHHGEYREIDRPRRLVFTLTVPKYSSLTAVIVIEIEPADGGCEVTLTQESVPMEWAEQSREGWTMILETLGGIV
jgi:uncharacterized protein YndB with AHSA1/START domain